MEYFSSADAEDLAKSIEESKGKVAGSQHLHFELVKLIVRCSFDRSPYARELASRFIAGATGSLIEGVDVHKAFSVLLERVEDLILDVPDVLQSLSCFIARAVTDEALSPAFLLRIDLTENDLGYQVISQAKVLLDVDKAAMRLSKVRMVVWVDVYTYVCTYVRMCCIMRMDICMHIYVCVSVCVVSL